MKAEIVMVLPLIFKARHCAGFTLVEMAIVMIIVMVLMGGMIATLSGQMDIRNQTQTEQTLADIREAILGFAVTQGRLPCPAYATGEESRPSAVCDHYFDGYVPGITLGLTPTDSAGYVLDGWNQRIRYSVTSAGGNVFTTNITLAAPAQYLSVCSRATGITGTGASATCTVATKLTDNAIAVIYSIGKNGGYGGTGTDEAANLNGDAAFVSHNPAATAGNEYDDLVIWLSPYTLYSRMIAAGRLP